MARTKKRPTPHTKAKLLTAYRRLENGVVTASGFARARRVSVADAVLEVPDPFPVGQVLSLEFLLDNNRIAKVEGQVARVRQGKVFYRVEVAFSKVPARARRLLAEQIK